ncbi:MAG: ArnT family glycosyltransferase, partial [Verrucomicrobiia bacterium]
MKLLDGSRVHTLLSLGVALLFAAILRVPIADIPLERDEGEYAYIGERWLRGEVPYRDAFDQKPPGVFLVYGAVIRTLGRSVSAIHWGAQIWSFGTVAAVWALARSAGGNAVGAAAGLLFSLLFTNPGVLGNAANAETFLILPSTLSLLAALRARRSGSARWALAAGVLAGMATLFKQVALTNALLSVWIVARGTRTRPKHDDLCIHVLQRGKEAGSVFGGGSGVLPEDRPWLRTGATKRAPPFS